MVVPRLELDAIILEQLHTHFPGMVDQLRCAIAWVRGCVDAWMRAADLGHLVTDNNIFGTNKFRKPILALAGELKRTVCSVGKGKRYRCQLWVACLH